MNKEQIEATLRLFKGYLIEEGIENHSMDVQNDYKMKAAEKGLVFTNLLNMNSIIFDEAVKQYGKDGEKWNQTFHKSFKTVLDTPIETLIAQQIIHYFTTYGLEALDLYNQDLVYIPHEQLDVPELQEDIPLVVIHKITEKELTEKLMVLLTSGIALSKQTVSDVMLLSDYIDKDKVDDIQNREVKTAMYDKYKIAPKNNIEFLRYIVYKATGSTLLIKNDSMIKSIKESDISKTYDYIVDYVSKPDGYKKLAEVFLRFKDLFLAFKRSDKKQKYAKEINKIINKISKLSDKYHKPMGINTLDRLTSITDDVIYGLVESSILEDLDKITIFREIRILNALAVRINGSESLVYRIRNGKTFVQNDTEKTDREKLNLKKIYDSVYSHLTSRLGNLLKDKKVYIPKLFNYAAPTSEKQFVGNIPEGSYVEIPRSGNMVMGIHWTNTSSRVDLDIHAQNKTQQVGWNSSYYTSDADLVFSGDVTDAPEPKGATELFLIKNGFGEKEFLITVNNYTGSVKNIPFEFVVASFDENNIQKNYVLDPNKIITTLPFKFEPDDATGYSSNQMTLGLVSITNDYIRFYFNKFELGKSIVTRRNSVNTGAFNYMNSYKEAQLRLNDLLIDSKVDILDEPVYETLQEVTVKNENGEDETLYRKVQTKADYDLSYESIDKETLIKLFSEV